MRPVRSTAVHKTGYFAELVCSNSFRSDDAEGSAIGLLHAEMRRLGSLVMRAAEPTSCRLAARWRSIATALPPRSPPRSRREPLIDIRREEISYRRRTGTASSSPPAPSPRPRLPTQSARSPARTRSLSSMPSPRSCIATRSISTSPGSSRATTRRGPAGSGADYINCPLTREQYEAFVDALLAGEKIAFHDFETATPYFDGCLPIEVMAERGRETLRHGPMKPFGLTDPHRPEHKALRGRAAAPGQQARHAVQHGGLSDQAEARRAGPHLPHHSGPRQRRVRPARRPAPQHVHQFAKAS